MGNVLDTEYVTATKDGRFIGGQPTDEYRRVSIPTSREHIRFVFEKCISSQGIQEIHCLTSETGGVEGKSGNPSGKHGANIWCRIKLVNGEIGNWVLLRTLSSPDEAAIYCVKICVNYVWAGEYELVKELAPKGTEIKMVKTAFPSIVRGLLIVKGMVGQLVK